MNTPDKEPTPKEGEVRARRARCGLCGCEHDEGEPVNRHGDCYLCARAQYE